MAEVGDNYQKSRRRGGRGMSQTCCADLGWRGKVEGARWCTQRSTRAMSESSMATARGASCREKPSSQVLQKDCPAEESSPPRASVNCTDKALFSSCCLGGCSICLNCSRNITQSSAAGRACMVEHSQAQATCCWNLHQRLTQAQLILAFVWLTSHETDHAAFCI